MSDPMHDLDVTVWVGKNGIEAVSDELSDQLDDSDAVKVKFLRAARAEGDTAELAGELAEQASGSVLDTRGHTAVIQR